MGRRHGGWRTSRSLEGCRWTDAAEVQGEKGLGGTPFSVESPRIRSIYSGRRGPYQAYRPVEGLLPLRRHFIRNNTPFRRIARTYGSVSGPHLSIQRIASVQDQQYKRRQVVASSSRFRPSHQISCRPLHVHLLSIHQRIRNPVLGIRSPCQHRTDRH